MTYVFAVLVGAVWGAAVGLVNMLIMRKALKKQKKAEAAGAKPAPGAQPA